MEQVSLVMLVIAVIAMIFAIGYAVISYCFFIKRNSFNARTVGKNFSRL